MGKRKNRKRYSGPDLTSHLGLNKGDLLDLDLGSHADDGNPLAEYDGAPVSVLGGLAGERVRAEVLWINPDVIYARTVAVLEASPHRRDAPCAYFLECTGCQWQHVSYSHQLELKRDRVLSAMADYAELSGIQVEPTVESSVEFGYRNHARFTVARWPENRGQVGFMSAVTRRFVKIDRCMLMNDPVNDVLEKVQGHLGGMSQFSVRASSTSGSHLIQPPLPAGDEMPESGQTHYTEQAAGRSFRVASPSFFQVNPAQLERMAELIEAMLQPEGSAVLLDAYSGVGTFAVLLSPQFERVIAIEESASGVRDAMENARGIENIEFIEGKSEEVMPGLSGMVDYVILDPPRSGCMPEVIESVQRLAPRRLVLVSCDTTAMARDQARMIEHGFDLVKVQPLDMFPQTRHVEVISLFESTTEREA